MFAALYGALTPHPWRDPDTDRDAYFLFHNRSLAMRWLTDIRTRGEVRIDEITARAEVREVADVGSVGLWGMHEAGQDADSGAAPSPVLWVQVGLDPVPADRPLPVQPLLCCAEDVAARIGTLRLDAVQVLLPVQHLHPASRTDAVMPSLDAIGWFGDCDPHARTALQVTLDGGRHPSIHSAAPQMLTWMQHLEQDVFTCDSFSLTDHDDLALRPPFFDGLWREPAAYRATFGGTLVEWSLDALGWLASFLADASARHGATTPLLLTASRAK
jgi:hypothetical protein